MPTKTTLKKRQGRPRIEDPALKRAQTGFYLPVPLIDRLYEFAEDRGTNKSAVASLALAAYLDSHSGSSLPVGAITR